MNSRQLTFLLIVALVLGAAGWFLFHRDVRSWESQPTSTHDNVINFPLNDVAHIVIRDGSSELNLVSKPEGWVVRERADYPANFKQVSRFLQKIWNLKPIETVQAGPSQFARLELTEPTKEAKSGILLDLKNNDDKRIAALLIGKKYLKKSNQGFGPVDFPAGRYVMPEDGSKHVFLIADPMADLVTRPERWLSRDFIKIEKPKSIALAGTTPGQEWKLRRERDSAEWKFAEAKPGEEVDKNKASSVANTLASLSFADVLDPNAKPESSGLDKPETVTVETEEGFTYALKIGKLSEDKYPVTISVEAALPVEPAASPGEKAEETKKRDIEFSMKKKSLEEKLTKEKQFEGRPFLINKVSIEQLLKNRADLIKAQPSPAPSPPPQPQRPKAPVIPKARP